MNNLEGEAGVGLFKSLQKIAQQTLRFAVLAHAGNGGEMVDAKVDLGLMR
jgi:hypothetical protein